MWESLLTSLVVGVVSGVIASYLFLQNYLKKTVPKIVLSEEIAKSEFDGEINHFFKFVNMTNCEIFDVRVELTLYKPKGAVGGINLQGTDIILKDDFFSYLSEKDPNDQRNLHAVQVRTTENIEEMWEDESAFVRLTIIARHSLSGLNKVFVQDYMSKDLIKSGKFIYTNGSRQLAISR